MLALDAQQSTLEHALVFYKKYLESLREQQENNHPRNGKAPANAEDLSVDRVFEEQLQAVASLLISTEESPEQIIQQINRTARPPPSQVPTVKPRTLDDFDTEPYIDPFTGQVITPNTPFTAGSSKSHIYANESHQERPGMRTIDFNQQEQTAVTVRQTLASNPPALSVANESAVEPEIRSSRSALYKSVESVSSIDTRSVVPAARSYASQPSIPDEVSLPRSRWGTLSRLKHKSSKASPKARSEKRGESLHKDDVSDTSHDIHDVGIAESASLLCPATPTDKVDTEARQNLHQLRHAKGLDPKPNDSQTGLMQNIRNICRYQTRPLSNQNINDDKRSAASINQCEALRSPPDISNGTQLERRQQPSAAETPAKSFWVTQAPETYPNDHVPPLQHSRKSPIRSRLAVSVRQVGMQPVKEVMTSPKNTMMAALQHTGEVLPLQASLGRTGQRAGDIPEFSSKIAELTLYEESVKLAFELSGGFPQDYAALKQIQEEDEISAQLLESQRLAKELAGSSSQNYADVSRLDAELESIIENSALVDIERQRILEADRKLAQSLVAEDVPQEIQEFQRSDGRRQMELQEEARIAKEIAERGDRAEIEAQLAIAQRLQAEWNATEASEIEEQQRLAREIAEQEDRLELERLQAEWNDQVPTQRTDRSMGGSGTSLDTNTQLVDQPSTHASQDKQGGKHSPPRLNTQRSSPLQHGFANTSIDQDAGELSRIIAERRARHSQWQAEVQKANQAAKEAEEAIRRRAREDEEEIHRLEQQQRSLAEKARKEEEARRAAMEAERQARQAECTVCADVAEKSDMAILSCKHAYCGECIAQAFQHALKGKKPFSCCRKQVPVDTIARFLPNNFVSLYQDIVLELATPNPTYCSNSSCSAFIPPPSIKADTATCPRCRTNTCNACRNREHPGVICAGDVNGQKLLGLASSKKWQQCPHCKMLMEKQSGCLHMTCRCGTESCYNCGGVWSVCGGTCPRR